MLKRIKDIYSNNARKKRAQLFRNLLLPKEQDKILDLGGGNGNHINMILENSNKYDVTVADILEDDLKQAREKFNFRTVQLKEGMKLPFKDREFDIVFCNSVIEHVTIQKNLIWKEKDKKKFEQDSLIQQKLFADEVRRISKSYFVQTPNKYFLIESHSWLPFVIVFLPRNIQIFIIKFFNKFWFKKTTPDWNLLTHRIFNDFFPEAEILEEKSIGLTKSLIAINKKLS